MWASSFWYTGIRFHQGGPTMTDSEDRRTEIALFRYTLILPLLRGDYPPGGKQKLRAEPPRQIASRHHDIPHSSRSTVSPSTLARWERLYAGRDSTDSNQSLARIAVNPVPSQRKPWTMLRSSSASSRTAPPAPSSRCSPSTRLTLSQKNPSRPVHSAATWPSATLLHLNSSTSNDLSPIGALNAA